MIPEGGVQEIKPKTDTGKRFRGMVVYTWDCPYCGKEFEAIRTKLFNTSKRRLLLLWRAAQYLPGTRQREMGA